MQIAQRLLAAAFAAAVALALGACGNSGSSTSGKVGQAGLPVPGQKKGGTLKVLSNESFQHLDPGQAYFQLDYQVLSAAQRQLYSYRPDNSKKPVPDLAVGDPEISDGGRTVTVKIKPGIRYSPGTVNRPVEAKDFKYAIERAFNPALSNGYAPTYFGDIVGAGKAKGGPLAGVQAGLKHARDKAFQAERRARRAGARAADLGSGAGGVRQAARRQVALAI